MRLEDWLGENNQLGIDIWHRKYQYNNETLDEWFDRVSGGNPEVKQLIKEKKFLFGGRILANRGLNKYGVKVTYSNCYVLEPPEDSIEDIYRCAADMARTFSYGGGVGIDISKLAPRGAKVNNTAKETSGAVSFMDLYALTTGLIGQNGRRGALMISLDCHHPDLEEFIDIKSDLDKVTTANISIKITNDFIEAALDHKPFELTYTRDETGETIVKTVDAHDLLMKLCFNNWDMGEPAMLFWDRIQDWNLLSNTHGFEYAGTNPCAEEPLPAGGSCLLGSMNLSAFVDQPFTDKAKFNFVDFNKSVKIAVKALNEVLDEGLALHPLDVQRNSVSKWRQIGTGITGLSDMLIKMGITYGSEESIKLCDDIGDMMINSALIASAELAKEYGPYDAYDYDAVTSTDFFRVNAHPNTKTIVHNYGLRNSQLLTIAPTGTLSALIGLSSGGVEPTFSNYYTRTTKSLHGEDVDYKIFTAIAWKYLNDHGYGEDFTKLPEYFITAPEIPVEQRIAMQAAWQKHIDASISSTVNLPYETTVEDIYRLYVDAWAAGLKGITVFRDGCRRVGILKDNSSNDASEDTTATTETALTVVNDQVPEDEDLPRGYIVDAIDDDSAIILMRNLMTGCGHLYITAKFDPVTGDLLEIFPNKGSSGGCICTMTGLTRQTSTSARAGVPIEAIIDQFKSCPPCPSYAVRSSKYHDTAKGSSCPVAIGFALEDMHKVVMERIGNDEDMEDFEADSYRVETHYADILPIREEAEPITESDSVVDESHTEQEWLDMGRCPICHEPLQHVGGCLTCQNDGYSKCD